MVGGKAGVEVEEGREVETEGSAEVEVEVEVEVGSMSRGIEAVEMAEVGWEDAIASDCDRAGTASVTTVLPFT